MIHRELFYEIEQVNGNSELDFLASELKNMDFDTIDFFRVTGATQYRPDLISLKYFGTYHLGWLLARYNEFLDPIQDFEIGVLIKIPNLREYYQFYSRNARTV